VTPGHVLFTKLLRCEHSELLETLARLAYALGARDDVAVHVLVARLIEAAGTHLRSLCACERSGNLVPCLPADDVARIIAARGRAIEEDFNLLHWSGWMRRRSPGPTPKHDHERDGPWTTQAD
jgi:hypothetical protein